MTKSNRVWTLEVALVTLGFPFFVGILLMFDIRQR